MMFPDEIVFEIRETVKGKEWALMVRFDGGENWAVETWNKKPAESTVERTKWTVIRSFEVLHRSMKIPAFMPHIRVWGK